MKRGFHPDVYEPAPKRGGLHKLKTLTRLLDMEEEWQDRLKTCAEETTIPARSLVHIAVKAAVQAIEESNYGLVLPMQFVLRYIPEAGLPAINPEALEIEPGMRVRFIRGEKLKRK